MSRVDTLPDPAEYAASQDRSAPDGYRFEWVVDDDWKVVDASGRCCRWMNGRKACGAPCVAALNRGRRLRSGSGGRVPSWWYYCGDHLYGRVLFDGRIWSLRLVSVEHSSTEDGES